MRSSSGFATSSRSAFQSATSAASRAARSPAKSGSSRAWNRSSRRRPAIGCAASAASTLPCSKAKPTCFSQRNIARNSQHSRQVRPERSTSRLNPSASAWPSSSAASASNTAGKRSSVAPNGAPFSFSAASGRSAKTCSTAVVPLSGERR